MRILLLLFRDFGHYNISLTYQTHKWPANFFFYCTIFQQRCHYCAAFILWIHVTWDERSIWFCCQTTQLDLHTHIRAYTHACAHTHRTIQSLLFSHTALHTSPGQLWQVKGGFVWGQPTGNQQLIFIAWQCYLKSVDTVNKTPSQTCGHSEQNTISNLWTQWTKHCLKPVATVNETLSQTCGHSEQNTVSTGLGQWTKHYLKPVDTVNETLSQTCGHSEPNVISNMSTQWTKHYFKPVNTVNETLFQTCGHGEQNAISHSYSAFLESCCRFMYSLSLSLMKIMKMQSGSWTVNPMPHSMCIVGTQQYRHHADGKCKHSEPHHCIQVKNPQNRKERRLNTTADQVS